MLIKKNNPKYVNENDSKDFIPGPPKFEFIKEYRTKYNTKELAERLNLFHEKYGPIYYCSFGINPTIVICDADLAKEVLIGKNLEVYQRIKSQSKWNIVGESLIRQEGKKWRDNRNLLRPSFNLKSLTQYFTTFKTIITKFDKILKQEIENDPDKYINIHSYMIKLTVDILGEVGFGLNFGALDDKMVDALGLLGSIMMYMGNKYRTLIPYYEYLPIESNKKMKENYEKLNNFIDKIIESRKKYIEETNTAENMLDVVITQNEFSQTQIRDNILQVFIAGQETSSATLTFCLYEIAKNNELEERLFEEIQKVTNREINEDSPFDFNEHVNFGDMDKFVLLNATIHETLRLYPPAPTIMRNAVKDVKLNGYIIPKYVPLCISVYTINRKKEYWGEDAESFNINRWLIKEEEQSNNNNDNNETGSQYEKSSNLSHNLVRHKYAFLSFSSGIRICIGNKFSIIEMKLGLINILSQYRLELDPSFKLTYSFHPFLRPAKGIPIRFIKRNNN